jgi:hypothetical protein
VKAAAPARNFIPAWHEGRHHQRRRGGGEHRCVPPRLDGRGTHKRREAAVLTLVATGRSGGIGVEWWCGSPAGKKTRAATRRRGSRGSMGCRRPRRRRVRLLPRAAPVFAADGSSHGRPLFSFSSPSPPAGRRAWQGSNSPRRLGLGSSRGLGGGLSRGARRWDTRTDEMRRGGGACGDGEPCGRRARLWLWASAKGQR